jgi:hypothetical protein
MTEADEVEVNKVDVGRKVSERIRVFSGAGQSSEEDLEEDRKLEEEKKRIHQEFEAKRGIFSN